MKKRLANQRARLQWVFEEYRIGRILLLFSFLLCIWLLAAVCIWVSEHSSLRTPPLQPGDKFYHFTDCLWCSTVYLVSGLEDFDPATLPSKVAAVVVMVVGVGVLGLTGAQLLATFVDRRRLRFHIRRKPSCRFSGHVVVCGWNDEALPLLTHLAANGDVVVLHPRVLDFEIPDKRLNRRVWGVAGETWQEEALRQADAKDARGVVVLGADAPPDNRRPHEVRDADALLVCLALTRAAPETPACVAVADPRNAPRFRILRRVEVLTIRNVAGKLLAHTAQKHGLTHCFEHLLFPGRKEAGPRFIPTPPALVGLTFPEARARLIEDETGTNLLLGVRRADGTLLINPAPGACGGAGAAGPENEIVLRETDELLVLSRGTGKR